MSVNNYKELMRHVGHKVEIACYGDREYPENVAVECITCNEVLVDYDRPKHYGSKSIRVVQERQ